jgi:hypothetical protein
MNVRRAARRRVLDVIESLPELLKEKALRQNAASRHVGKKYGTSAAMATAGG